MKVAQQSQFRYHIGGYGNIFKKLGIAAACWIIKSCWKLLENLENKLKNFENIY